MVVPSISLQIAGESWQLGHDELPLRQWWSSTRLGKRVSAELSAQLSCLAYDVRKCYVPLLGPPLTFIQVWAHLIAVEGALTQLRTGELDAIEDALRRD